MGRGLTQGDPSGDAPRGQDASQRRWQEDFPIEWERDHYVTRRELAKFLTLGSALLLGANVLIAFFGRTLRPRRYPALLVARGADLPPGGAVLFRYPTEEDPCILLRTARGDLRAYSQVCTHLSCAVVYRPEKQQLFCPCHNGVFSCPEGRPISGPPTRRLPRVLIEERGDDLVAVGLEASTGEEG